jgi:hypothetical protein
VFWVEIQRYRGSGSGGGGENTKVTTSLMYKGIIYIDVSLYLTLTIQVSSRLKRSANHLWNNSDNRKQQGKHKKGEINEKTKQKRQ